MAFLERLTTRYILLLMLIVALGGVIAYQVFRAKLIDNLDTTLTTTAHSVAETYPLHPVTGDSPSEQRVVDLNSVGSFRGHEVYVQIWAFEDGVLTLKAASASIAGLDMPLDAAALNGGGEQYSAVYIEDVPLRVYTQPVLRGDQPDGAVQVAGNLTAINQTTSLLASVLVAGYVVIVASLGALLIWFSRQMLKPVEEIASAAASITTTDDLQTRLAWNGSIPEIRSLTTVFNRMMDRIERLFNAQRRFISNVSHELRTPLTAIRGNVEIIRRYGWDMASLEAIEVESKRMSRLVSDMLMLARADYGDVPIDLYPVDLDIVVREVISQCLITTEDRQLEIRLDRCEPLCIKGNVDRIKQLVMSLVDNAVKFTPDGGEVSVRVERVGDNAVLSIKDTGIGIARENLDRLFDPFFQVEPSRAHDTGGFGLGLSIAKWIVEAHHGTIAVNSHLGEGTVFTTTLPLFVPSASLDNGEGQKGVNPKNQAGVQLISKESGVLRGTFSAKKSAR